MRNKAASAALILTALACGIVCAAPKPAPHAHNNLQGLGATSGRILITQPDPKNLNWNLWKMNVGSVSGAAVSNGFQGAMTDVRATIFKVGKPSAVITAPRATGNNVDMILVASGGILMKSLVENGTQLKADRVIWYARTNKVVAEGHVVYRYGKSGMTVTGPMFVADTALKTIRSSVRGRVIWPKGF